MQDLDRGIVVCLNNGVGAISVLDLLIEWRVSDYFITLLLGLALVAIWFGSNDPSTRIERQIGVLVSLFSMAIANLIVLIANIFYFRDRPFIDLDLQLLFYEPTDSSMPANSSAAFFGLAFAFYRYNKKLGGLLILIASIHGFLRVYTGVHYPSDIIVGALIGAITAFVGHRFFILLRSIPNIVVKLFRFFCVA